MQNHDRHKIENIIRITYNNSSYIHYFKNQKRLYDKIKDCQYVPKMVFFDNYIEVPYSGISLDKLKSKNINLETKKKIKKQIIEFMHYLYNNSIAHRDIWINNICWDGSQIWVIDWEYILEHNVTDIKDHYDLNGNIELSPESTNGMHILKETKRSLKSWLYPVSIKLDDFEIS